MKKPRIQGHKNIDLKKVSQVALITLVMSMVLAIGRPAGADSFANEAEAVFKTLEVDLPKDDQIPNQDGSQLAWGWSYILMGYVAMYEGTGNREYLNKALPKFEKVLQSRSDNQGLHDAIRQKVMPAWVTPGYTEGKQYAWLAHSGMIIYPIARWAYVVKRDPQLHPQYGNTADRLIKAISDTVAAFDEDWRENDDKNEGYYYDAYLKRDVPFNQQNAFGRVLVALWLATGDDAYRDKAEKLARFFKNRLILKNRLIPPWTRYTWPYWAGGESSEDIGHAAINVDFAFLCHKAGMVFTEVDMERFCATLRYCARGKGFSYYIDGTGEESLSRLMGLWGHLGFFDPQTRRLLYHYFKQNWPTRDRTWMTTAAYLVETRKPLESDKVVH